MSGPVRVLYIDDDAALGRLMQRALAPKGIAIEHVADPEQALALLQDGGYQLVALDHDLGFTTGLDVLARIRTLEPAPPVIYVTGSDNARIAVAALKAGAVDYVWKDVEGHYRELFVESVTAALTQEELKREKERAERETRAAKERAELLLAEVNHRVANSLALVAALARMQAGTVADESSKRLLQDMQMRIHAISNIHRRLYTSQDVRFVEMDAYVASLAQDLNAAITADARRTQIRLDIEGDLQVPTDKAVSIGVLITELVTNAYKYAYPDDGAGEIRVALRRIDDGAGDREHSGDVSDEARLRLTVEDDGIGWTGSGDVQGTGMGSRVIKAMATNLKSEVVYDPSHRGTRVVMEFAV